MYTLRRISSLVILSSILLVGCSSKSNNNTVPTDEKVSEYNLSYEVNTNALTNTKYNKVVFNSNESVPIIDNGKLYGYLKIMRVEKLGINDWKNSKAVKNSVNFSYSINLYFNLKESSKSLKAMSITPQFYLVDEKDNLVGEPCSVSWNGFPSTAELYTNSYSTTVESGLQPYNSNLSKAKYLKLKLVCEDKKFDDVYFNLYLLKKCKDGADLIKSYKTFDVKSINGAIYSIQPIAVYKELHSIEDRDSDLREAEFYDIVYKVTYKKAPTNSIQVGRIDTFSVNQYLDPFMKISLDTKYASTMLYDSNKYAVRLMYSDSSSEFDYVTDVGSKKLKVGQSTTIITNRQIPSNYVSDDGYVRLIFEFPEESKARTSKEIRTFDGKNLVYQLKILTRELVEEDD